MLYNAKGEVMKPKIRANRKAQPENKTEKVSSTGKIGDVPPQGIDVSTLGLFDSTDEAGDGDSFPSVEGDDAEAVVRRFIG